MIKKENKVPSIDAHKVDTEIHSVPKAISQWEIELNDSSSHKYIPAEVYRMLPFGLFPNNSFLN